MALTSKEAAVLRRQFDPHFEHEAPRATNSVYRQMVDSTLLANLMESLHGDELNSVNGWHLRRLSRKGHVPETELEKAVRSEGLGDYVECRNSIDAALQALRGKQMTWWTKNDNEALQGIVQTEGYITESYARIGSFPVGADPVRDKGIAVTFNPELSGGRMALPFWMASSMAIEITTDES